MLTFIKIALVLILLLILAVWAGVHFIAPYAILQPYRQPDSRTPLDYGLEYEDWSIKGIDGIDLAAYYVPPVSGDVQAHIILLPGIGSAKEAWLDLAKMLAQQHIATVLLDHRAQGQSGGQYATFGALEKQDVSKVIDRLEDLAPGLTIGVWGHSFGAAVALQSMAYDERIDFGISQSTFSRLEVIVADYFQRYSGGWGPRWLAKYALKRAGKVAGFKPKNVQPMLVASQIEQPVFVAHGDQDIHITPDNAQLIFDQLGCIQKELEIVAGADHNNLGLIGGAELLRKQMDFIERSIPINE